MLKKWPFYAALLALIIGGQLYLNRNLASGEAPVLAGRTLAGMSFRLADLQGRPALIYFWASWCGICKTMHGSLNAIARDHPVISLALQSGDRDKVRAYMAERGIDYPVLLDEDGAIGQRYGIRGVPTVFIIGPEGSISSSTVGYTSEAGLRLRLWLAGL